MKMKTFLISIFSAALLAGVAIAQDTGKPAPDSPSSPRPTPATQSATSPSAQAPQAGAAPAQGSPVTRIAPGSVIPVLLTKTIDAKKVKTGDEVVAKVTQDLKSTNGELIVAKDTKVLGHVTEAQARNKEQKESEVAIAFDRAVMTDGSQMQVPMSIQAIIGPQNSGPQNGQSAGGGAGDNAPSGANTGAMGQRPGMGGSAPAAAPSAPAGGGDTSANAQNASARPPITAQTQGVIGISHLTLAPAATPNNAQGGSIVTSEKSNVKLESGTMMLLRVN
jgi:hypothetical protein